MNEPSEELQRLLGAARRARLPDAQRQAIRQAVLRRTPRLLARWGLLGVGAAVLVAVLLTRVSRPTPAPVPLARQGAAAAAPAAKVEPARAPEPPAAPVAAKPRPAAPPRAVRALPAPEDALAAELEVLGQASRALATGQPEQALGFAEQHRLRFPHGALVEEREAVRLLARCAQPGFADAGPELARFLEAWPRSAQRQRLEAACAR
ncbi:MAG: hypothetical protein IPJ65_03590 [Archangiaceae bacterium]|nr:hypothetical protein [Archangiaceae bacterium]